MIPKRHACDGADISPPLTIDGIPDGTQSLAIIMTDIDTPRNFVHWLLYDMPLTSGIPEGKAPGATGHNDFGQTGYGGPCPPSGTKHRYVITCHALDTKIGLAPGQSRNRLLAAMENHIITSAELAGFYTRPSRG